MSLSWHSIARRIRVPLGFLVALLFLVLARPTVRSLLWSLLLVIPGLFLRGYASGYVKKNAELTMTGPYAFTRNPLYLGSFMIAFGFAMASRSPTIALVLAVGFAFIYIPVIRAEEEYLRATFAEFQAYASHVPRLIPRLTKAEVAAESGSFSMPLYVQHREYNALLGAVGIYAALLIRPYVVLLLHLFLRH
jgi:protein-S-isoprenylcysteine O-methyltransferase Ste14